MPGVFSKFVKTVVPGVIKPIRVLWNEMIGFVFIVFAVMFGGQAYRKWFVVQEGKESVIGFAGVAFLASLMLLFGVTSFLRARKINRS